MNGKSPSQYLMEVAHDPELMRWRLWLMNAQALMALKAELKGGGK